MRGVNYTVSDFGVCYYSGSNLSFMTSSVPSPILRSTGETTLLLPSVTFPPFRQEMVANEIQEMSQKSATVRIIGTNRGLKRS